jgi:hypothetical protein
MTSPGCTDPELGALLFAYETGALSAEDTKRFELHLLECEHCFKEAESFSKYSKMLREDEIVRDEIVKIPDSTETSKSIRQRLWSHLWPARPLPFRPAIVYLLILVLLYPAYRGVFHTDKPDFSQVQSISLVPARSTGQATFLISSGLDGIISFVYHGAVPGKEYSVVIKTEDGSVIMSDDSFTAFDNFKTGWLRFPVNLMKPGLYRLDVRDPEETQSGNKQSYSFRIIK